MTGHEVPFLLANSPGHVKITLPSATQFPMLLFQKGITDNAYANHSLLLADIAAMISAEVGALASDGVRYIQIDAPRYSWYIDPKWREKLRADTGMDPELALDEAIAADNKAFDAARAAAVGRDIILAIHLCRGNNRGNWYAEGGYDAIAEKLFGNLRVDRFLLEYDDERSGGFGPWYVLCRMVRLSCSDWSAQNAPRWKMHLIFCGGSTRQRKLCRSKILQSAPNADSPP